jgi:hypothetical protein
MAWKPRAGLATLRRCARPGRGGGRDQAAGARLGVGAGDEECNEWVAANVTGRAEEVLKVVASLRAGDDLNAAAQRSVIAQRLAIAVAIHRRILYGSENRLWSLTSCRSALELFELAVQEVRVRSSPSASSPSSSTHVGWPASSSSTSASSTPLPGCPGQEHAHPRSGSAPVRASRGHGSSPCRPRASARRS